MKIAIITDGNNTLGMGHVYQSVTLAGELLKRIDFQSEIFFITKSEYIVVDRLSCTNLKVYQYADDDVILNALVNEELDRIIFDKLDVSPLLAKRIKEIIGCKLIIFTNLTTANQYADMTVLAGMGSNFKNVRKIDDVSGAVHYYGPKYWMLRPEFFAYTQKTKKPLSCVKRIMLMFGGADKSNFTSTVLNELLCMDSAFEIKVVVGSAFQHNKELHAVVEQERVTRSSIQVVYDLIDVAAAMHQADVVFTSPGLSYYEALAVGTPVVGFHQNEMQRDAHREHLITLDKSELFKLSSIIENKSFIFPGDPLIATMEIGQGKDEIIQTILS
jgi:spore coat polysaccharide biosynthesis predicted glycosyltransferase SpsG